MSPLISQLQPHELEDFTAAGYTMGGMMVFPGNKVNGKLTINGGRGFLRRIATGWTSPWNASGGTTKTTTAPSLRP